MQDPWFTDETTLLDELRRGLVTRIAPPRVPGYDDWEEIGRGGQGTVYSATQRSTRRSVAVKVLHPGPVEVERRRLRFEREIEAIAALDHPGIVTVHDGGVSEDGRLYFVMERVEGVPLERAFDSLGDPDDPAVRRRVVELVLPVVRAIDFAHRRGVIHRDLKPGNVLVDGDGRPRVVDFGIARLVDDPERATREGQLVGTLATAAPEQFSGDPDDVDLRTDVHGLGTLLYIGLTGEPPHAQRTTPFETIRAIVEEEPEAPSRRRARTRGIRTGRNDDLDAIVLRACARDPDRRYASTAALADDLERYLEGRPIQARSDDLAYVVRRAVARNRVPCAIGAILLLAVVAFAVVTGAYARRTSLEVRKAQQIRVFLEDTLGSVEPRRPGHAVTVEETLHEAIHWVEIALADEPEVEASLRHTIGNSYRALGNLDAAEEQLSRALERRLALHGEHHLETASTVNAVGLLRRDQGRTDAAETLFRRGLAIRERVLGPDALPVSSSLVNLARLHLSSARTAAARRLLERALAIRIAHRPDDHPDVAMVRFDLARVAEAEGDRVRAIALHERALRARSERLHPDHPDIARSQLSLVRLWLLEGLPGPALPVARECFEMRRAFLGPDDDRTARAEAWYGAALRASGDEIRVEEGTRRLRSALDRMSPDAPDRDVLGSFLSRGPGRDP